MNKIIRFLYAVTILALALTGCGTVPISMMGDAVAPLDAAQLPDGAFSPDAQSVEVVTQGEASASDAQAPTDSALVQLVDGGTYCNGCYLGANCVPPSGAGCGLNSACVICPAPTECSIPTCLATGLCGRQNQPDGTGCSTGECVRGACSRCGTMGDMACTHGGNPCNPGLSSVNVGDANHPSYACFPCGTQDTGCCSSTLTGGEYVTLPDGSQQARHPGGSCGANLVCNTTGVCSCGHLNEPCCGGTTCSQGRCSATHTCV